MSLYWPIVEYHALILSEFLFIDIDNHYHLNYHLEMIVCICKSVSDREISAEIESGVTSYEGLQHQLGVGTQCGSCSCEVKDLLQAKQIRNRCRSADNLFAQQLFRPNNALVTS